MKDHWNTAYLEKTDTNLGWYEADPEPSLSLIEACKLSKESRMLHVGAGTSILIDKLLDYGYQNLLVNDISTEAIRRTKDRVGKNNTRVKWIVDDLINSRMLKNEAPVDLWHDRAVLHFFISESDRKSYFDLLKKLVIPGGYVIIAVFSLDGAEQCSGLPVYRYSEGMITSKLGDEFSLIKALDHLYTTPSGGFRPYIYTLYKRS